MGMEAAMAAFTTVFGLAALSSRVAECADYAACSPSHVGAAAFASVGAAIACNASAALIAAAWRAFRQSRAARAAARLAVALTALSWRSTWRSLRHLTRLKREGETVRNGLDSQSLSAMPLSRNRDCQSLTVRR